MDGWGVGRALIPLCDAACLLLLCTTEAPLGRASLCPAPPSPSSQSLPLPSPPVRFAPCLAPRQDLPFDAANSSSFADVQCGADECLGHQCDTDGRCAYARHYAEDSSSSGIIASDLVSFGAESDIPHTRILFGCELKETGDLFSQKADGIVGLGQGPLSIVNQLAEARAVEPVFSLCYGGMDAGGGAMVLGETHTPEGMQFTPLDPKRE